MMLRGHAMMTPRISAASALVAGLTVAVALLTTPVSAFAQNAARIAAGEAAWDKAGCLHAMALPAKAAPVANFPLAQACAQRRLVAPRS